MDTERCREFVVLAQTCNYLQAADQLFISQSSLSKHIKALERELGVELFNRTTRRVQLTEHGRVFLPFARKLAATAHDAEVAMANATDNERRIVDIGSIPVMVPYGITEVVHCFERDHPNVRLRMTEGEADYLKDLLRKRKLDLAFIREWDGSVGLEDEALGQTVGDGGIDCAGWRNVYAKFGQHPLVVVTDISCDGIAPHVEIEIMSVPATVTVEFPPR